MVLATISNIACVAVIAMVATYTFHCFGRVDAVALCISTMEFIRPRWV